MQNCLLLLVLSMLPSPANAADWVRIETPNFVVFGQIGEKRTRDIAAEFERFREAIGQVLPSAAIASAVPTTVVVFESQKAFTPYKPRYDGKPVQLSGFFMGSESDNMIALTVEDRDNALRVVLHEYTHLITANVSRALPSWVNEGLAEFYSTFAVSNDGNRGVLGKVIPSHYLLLGRNDLLPLEQLLTVDHTSPLYNEGLRRSVFYAQSWAMVHMFLAGEPNRSKEFGEYIRLAAGGTPAVEAWRQAFGSFDANKALRRYLSKPTVRNYAYRFDDRVGRVDSSVSQPKGADVEAILAALLRYWAPNEVEPRLRRAIEMTPSSMLTRALLGLARVQSNEYEEGEKLLVEAASDKTDWLVQYHVANGLTRILRSTDQDRDSRIRSVARGAVDAVLSARPDLAHALALKADLQGGAAGVASVARARALAPGREDYVFLEARLRADARDFAAARSVLSLLLTPRFPPEVRERARSMMGQVVQREQYHAARQSEPAVSANPSPAAAPPGITAALLREVKDGEQRLEGTLEKLECSRNGAVTLIVRAGRELKRFTAAAFSDIEFITYRQEQQGGRINCGERKPPEAVYVTWMPLPTTKDGILGRPVAVEFLPVK